MEQQENIQGSLNHSEFLETDVTYIEAEPPQISQIDEADILCEQDGCIVDGKMSSLANIPTTTEFEPFEQEQEQEQAITLEEQYEIIEEKTHVDEVNDDFSQSSDLSESEPIGDQQSWKSDMEDPQTNGTTQFLQQESDLMKETWRDMAWKCLECGEQFTDVMGLRLHVGNDHPDVSVRYSCVDCSKVFTKYYPYIRHVRNIHKPHLKYW